MVRICCHRVNSETDIREFLVEWKSRSAQETPLSWEPSHAMPIDLVRRYEAALRKLLPNVDTQPSKLAPVDAFKVIPLAIAGDVDLQKMAQRQPGLHL